MYYLELFEFEKVLEIVENSIQVVIYINGIMMQ